MNFLGFLAPLLGIIMEWIYKLIPSYGWTLIIFTLLTKILMFPLSVKQQKSTARMSHISHDAGDTEKMGQ